MIPADDDQLWSYRIAEVEERLSGIGWTEPRLPWGVHPLRWHLSQEECSTTFCSDLFSCPSDLCEEAEVVYTALAYGSRAARLSRSMDDYDSEPYGYAVPVGGTGFFPNVGRFGDSFVVSSIQLADECERLAALLELPTQFEPETIRAAMLEHPHDDVVKWQRYGVESFVFATLLNAARCSVRTGCVIVFS